jgi:glycosyltransferase involved in cell wall biosynthesis
MSVAVIIPAYNAAPYLREAVESAQRQTVPPTCIVVVNDGSSDRTEEVMRSLEPHITAVTQENAGVSAARNRGVAAAPLTEWLLFLDADDRLVPDALARLLERHERSPNARLIYGQAVCFYEDESQPSWTHGDARSEGPAPSAARANFWKSALTTPGVALIQRSLYDELGGFDPRFCPTEDRDFWIKAGTVAEFAFTGSPTLERRLHGSNASHARGRLRIQGTRAQLELPAWLREHGLPVDLLGIGEREILEQNLRRALESRQWDAVAWLLAEAQRRDARLVAAKLARRLVAAPNWWRNVELSVRQRFGAMPVATSRR